MLESIGSQFPTLVHLGWRRYGKLDEAPFKFQDDAVFAMVCSSHSIRSKNACIDQTHTRWSLKDTGCCTTTATTTFCAFLAVGCDDLKMYFLMLARPHSTGNAYIAIKLQPDVFPDYEGMCGRCYEIKCRGIQAISADGTVDLDR